MSTIVYNRRPFWQQGPRLSLETGRAKTDVRPLRCRFRCGLVGASSIDNAALRRTRRAFLEDGPSRVAVTPMRIRGPLRR